MKWNIQKRLLFLVMTAGLACAAGYVVIALLFTILVSLVILLLSHLSFGQKEMYELHITVPETLQFAGAFEDNIFKHTRQVSGTLFTQHNLGLRISLLQNLTIAIEYFGYGSMRNI